MDGSHDNVFPTCVGVNRLSYVLGGGVAGVPHMRGGEPTGESGRLGDSRVFPTCVGLPPMTALSRLGNDRRTQTTCPHTRWQAYC